MDYNKLIEQRKIVYNRIKDTLNRDDFELSIKSYVGIHEELFKGIFFNCGKFRKNNLSKEEDILNNESVDYPDYHTVPTYLKFAFNDESRVDYSKLSKEEKIAHVAIFMAKLWNIHPFNEGNTRTTTVYIEKYLKKLGFETDNDIFKENAEYVRNTLVRACYDNPELEITCDIKPLINLLTHVINNDNTFEKEDLYIKELFTKKNVKTRKRKK